MPQLGVVTEHLAHQLSSEWFSAWNRHDLDAITSHYADAVEFASPFVARILGEPTGVIQGKALLREYFARALAAYPELKFTGLHVLVGVNSLVLQYRSVKNLVAAEAMTLNAHNQITRVQVHYASDPVASAFSSQAGPETATRPCEWFRADYLLTDDPQQSDLDAVCSLLHATYWANDRSREVIEKGIRHSTLLSVIHQGRQVGLIRAVTDHATFTWVCDVVVDPDHRGKGLGKWMVQCLLEHPDLQTISHHLCTKDAHSLYESFGFQRIEAMRRSDRPMPFLQIQHPPTNS